MRPDPPSRIERDEDVIEMIDLTGEERIARVVDRRVEKQNPIKRIPRIAAMSDRRKHLLFMNPGDEKIMEAAYALAQGGFPPKWAQPPVSSRPQRALALAGERPWGCTGANVCP